MWDELQPLAEQIAQSDAPRSLQVALNTITNAVPLQAASAMLGLSEEQLSPILEYQDAARDYFVRIALSLLETLERQLELEIIFHPPPAPGYAPLSLTSYIPTDEPEVLAEALQAIDSNLIVRTLDTYVVVGTQELAANTPTDDMRHTQPASSFWSGIHRWLPGFRTPVCELF